MRSIKYHLLTIICVFSFAISGLAQVTSSSITGTVKNAAGEIQPGATVKAIHQPTGTVSTVQTDRAGIYNIVNLIPGGPYSVVVTFVGFENIEQNDIRLQLGENLRLDLVFGQTKSAELETVTITGSRVPRKTGAATSIGKEQIASLPTLSRGLSDFTRLTPQANGNSFGGANNRFNNITIDGAVNNDVFGLAGSGTPGGQAGTQPISLDAISELQVVLAPYDVSYGNFTGAGVNAVTRSGTNNFEGSVYYFVRNENTIGRDPVTKAASDEFSIKQYGFRLGGPIIKNKLFFFVNGELGRETTPSLYNIGQSSVASNATEINTLADYVRTTYGYDVGGTGLVNTQRRSDKVFARLDWNINDVHRLTLRHNYIKAYDDIFSRSNTIFRYGNNGYRFNNEQNITVMELKSRFSNQVSNSLIIGLHKIRDFRSTSGALFPQVEIAHNGGTIQLGSDRSSTANALDQDIFEITNNLKLFKGAHTITIGTHNEFYKFSNLFINNLNGRWQYQSLQAFYDNRPNTFATTFSNIPGEEKPRAAFNAAQLGLYIQDEWRVNNLFSLTYGLRADMPLINTTPADNPAAKTLGDYSTSNVPNKQILWSPRVGFNYDLRGDKKYVLRGGVGIFTGRVPFVWISNQFSNTGLMLSTISQNGGDANPSQVNGGNGFIPDATQQHTAVGNVGNTFEMNLIDKDFKLPQVLRANIAVDMKLPGGINGTLEAMYSQTINNVLYKDINLDYSNQGTVNQQYNQGADQRVAYGSTNNDRRINDNITNAIFITNTNKGHTYNLTASLNKSWSWLYLQAAYNYNIAKDINSGTSSTALSNWEFVQVVGDPNIPSLAYSSHMLRHRITGVATFNLEWSEATKTTISFFYQGNSGQRFTYLTNADLNSDGRTGNDLLYVPANASEIKFNTYTTGGVTYTPQQQSDAFFAYIDGDKYLSSRKGKYAERNGAELPWQHVVDMRIARDYFFKIAGKKHSVQLTLDIFNVTNLINKEWGRQYFVSNQAATVLGTSGSGAGAGYTFNPNYNLRSMNFGSRWQGQFGVRYSF
ncbi:TonB-dependent receptor [Gynurincola endophyticus]|uniref:TonB-dependent receptor n=1 Tax=Gynurincola endophyticus TaxID=2479004 RepID=UPI000F8D5FE8|nr:TonB-dependent receptor [Gynurincola endophyticus]